MDIAGMKRERSAATSDPADSSRPLYSSPMFATRLARDNRTASGSERVYVGRRRPRRETMNREATARGSVPALERNLVVLDVRLGRTPAASARPARRARRRGRGLLGLADGDAFHVRGAVEELHVRGVDFERVALLAVAVSPLLHVQAALDVDAPTLRQILRDVLGLPAHALTRNHVVMSCCSPALSRRLSFVAAEKLQTAV